MTHDEYYKDIETLRSAEEARNEADLALETSERQQAAVLINYASECGEYEALWQRPMSDELKAYLEGQGYTVTPWRHVAVEGDIWLISWK